MIVKLQSDHARQLYGNAKKSKLNFKSNDLEYYNQLFSL